MSGSTLANIVNQLRAAGEKSVIVECDGHPVLIELKPAPKVAAKNAQGMPGCKCLGCTFLRIVALARNQNVALN